MSSFQRSFGRKKFPAPQLVAIIRAGRHFDAADADGLGEGDCHSAGAPVGRSCGVGGIGGDGATFTGSCLLAMSLFTSGPECRPHQR